MSTKVIPVVIMLKIIVILIINIYNLDKYKVLILLVKKMKVLLIQ